MTLSDPVERELLHLRDVALRGFRRADGLFEIEARLTDTKTYGFGNADRGWIEPGVPLHGMEARMTVDETGLIIAFEAFTEHGPYAICPAAAANFGRLAGLHIGPGFLRAAAGRVGGVEGCTHLRELLQPMATVAFQTLAATRAEAVPTPNRPRPAVKCSGEQETGDRPPGGQQVGNQKAGKPALLDTCLAYASGGAVARRTWPHLSAADD